jgi:flavin reductase (DIM6/NTAB) family NADH-FMN oxidoreductase RutF
MMSITGLIKRSLLKSLSFPQYAAVGLRDPQNLVTVLLHGLGKPLDVTRNNVVVALRPLTIGVMLPADAASTRSSSPLCALEFREQAARKRLMGSIALRQTQDLTLPGHTFRLFEQKGCENRCLPALQLWLYHRLEERQARRRQREQPYNFQLVPSDLRALLVFYICPRPVSLVTVVDGERANTFPMDLIGPTDSPWFSMALRLSSPAVALIERSRRLAVASIPVSYKTIAYELGKHHSRASIDWTTLPFRTVPSTEYRLPVPEASIGVREVHVEECRPIGSHMLFITSVARESALDAAPDSLQLFHIHGAYRQHLRRRGIPMVDA